jgi:hypothetical protein
MKLCLTQISVAAVAPSIVSLNVANPVFNILHLISSLHMRQQVPHPYKTARNIIFCYSLCGFVVVLF